MIEFDSINFQWEADQNKLNKRLIIIVNDAPNILDENKIVYETRIKDFVKNLLNKDFKAVEPNDDVYGY